jgi:hypothetical protein
MFRKIKSFLNKVLTVWIFYKKLDFTNSLLLFLKKQMAMMQDGQDEKADISSLLEVNRLDYRLPPSLSIATSRAMKVYKAQESSYVAGQAQCQFTLSSGATYVDFLNSWLRFTVAIPAQLAGVVPKMSPHAGWAQLIRQIRIIHSSGVEIDRMKDSVGEWIQIQNYYNRSEQNRRTQGSLYDLNDTARAADLRVSNSMIENAKKGLNLDLATSTAALPPGDYLSADVDEAFHIKKTASTAYEVEVCIPLCHLSGFFDCDLLAPQFLAAGLQVHIDFYSPEHFFICGSPSSNIPYGDTNPWVGDLKVVNPEMHLETFTLTDSILRKLSQISAASGLEWYFDAVHQMNVTISQGDLAMQITRALSRANNVIVKTRNAKDLGNTYKDSYASQPYTPTVKEGRVAIDDEAKFNGALREFQVQLGAQYIPSRSMSTKNEILHSALKTFSQFRRSDELGGPDDAMFSGIRVSKDTATTAATIRYLSGLAVAAVPLESSSTLQQSGAAISAQRTAVVNMAWEGETDPASIFGLRRVDAFVVYSKLATLFLDSVVVRS